jgi:hypothetical protein
MTGSVIIDVVLGLIFFFLIYSLLATIIQELVATFWEFRSKMLERAIRRMLLDDDVLANRLKSAWQLFFKSRETQNIQQQMKTLTTEMAGKSTFVMKPDDVELQKQALYAAFYAHPLIKYLGESRKGSKPSYLNKDTFSKVIIDLLKGNNIEIGQDGRTEIETSLKQGTTNWNFDFGNAHIPKNTQNYLKSLWVDAQGDIQKFTHYIEKWFDETMDRTTGWYKKHTQLVLLIIGSFLAVIFNLDAIAVAKKLSTNPALREQMVKHAEVFVAAHPNLEAELKNQKLENQKLLSDTNPKNNILKTKAELDTLNRLADSAYKKNKATRDTLIAKANRLLQNDIKQTNELLGVGLNHLNWDICKHPLAIFFNIIGWAITALAISVGAPFWFDMLNKVMQLRSSVAGFSGKKDVNKKELTEEKTVIQREG